MQDHIYIYGHLGDTLFEEGIKLKDIVPQVTKKSDEIVVHIHSGGGSVYEAVAIHDFLINSGKKITTIIEGLAGSAATFLSQAGDKDSRFITQNSDAWIHLPQNRSTGNADDMEKMAKELRRIENKVINMYQRWSSASTEKLMDWMKEETFFTADEWVQEGFASAVLEPTQAVAYHDLSKLKNIKSIMSKQIDNHKETVNLINQFTNWLSGKEQNQKPQALNIALATDGSIDIETDAQEPQEGDIVTKDKEVLINATVVTHYGDEITTDGQGKITKIDKYEEVQNRKNMNFQAKLDEQNTAFEAKIEALKTTLEEKETALTEAKTELSQVKSSIEEQKTEFQAFKNEALKQLNFIAKNAVSDYKPGTDDASFADLNDEGVDRDPIMASLSKMKAEMHKQEN